MSLLGNLTGESGPTNVESCGVTTCDETDFQVVELKPLDPIDHNVTLVPLCSDHQAWAEERNALAERVADELREERKRIGQEHIDDVQDLRDPPEGTINDGVAIDNVKESLDMVHSMLGEEQ